MNPSVNSNKIHTFTSALFRYRYIKIITLLTLHILGALILSFLIFIFVEYITSSIGFWGGKIVGQLWNNLSLNILPPLILSLSLLVILIPNPIYALVCLILVFFSTALFLIGIHVEFLALIYVIIYIGAIAILFLFVIMMFNLKELRDSTSYTQNKDFLMISLSFYLVVLSKFHNIFVNSFLNYAEYDLYINQVITLKYNLLYSWTQILYNTFIEDILFELKNDLIQWNLLSIDPYHILTSITSKTHTWDIMSQIYSWYLQKITVTVSSVTQDQNFCLEEPFFIEQALHNINSDLCSLFSSKLDILICGQVFYTYYSYLFLIGTFILLISMVGAIILALSTTEKTITDFNKL